MNNSKSSSPANTFHFTVDEVYAKAHNEYLGSTKRMQISAFSLAVIMFVIGATALYSAHGMPWGWMAMIAFATVGLSFVAVALIIPKKVGTAQQLYDKWDLAPALVAEVNEHSMVILALVNRCVNREADPSWALTAQIVNNLEGHRRTVGEKVPCVAIPGRGNAVKDKHFYQQVTPMPIAWGTRDAKIVDQARQQISSAQWKKLRKNMDLLPQAKQAKLGLVPLQG